jgi:hypothetical protein
MGRACSTNGKRNAYTILVGNSEGKRPLGRPRHRWVDNVKMDQRETGWGGVDWTDLAQDRDWRRVLVYTRCFRFSCQAMKADVTAQAWIKTRCPVTHATSRKVADFSPGWGGFFNVSNPSNRTMVLGSSQPLTKMSTRNLSGGKKRPAGSADNLTAICEPNVWKCGSLNLSQP